MNIIIIKTLLLLALTTQAICSAEKSSDLNLELKTAVEKFFSPEEDEFVKKAENLVNRGARFPFQFLNRVLNDPIYSHGIIGDFIIELILKSLEYTKCFSDKDGDDKSGNHFNSNLKTLIFQSYGEKPNFRHLLPIKKVLKLNRKIYAIAKKLQEHDNPARAPQLGYN